MRLPLGIVIFFVVIGIIIDAVIFAIIRKKNTRKWLCMHSIVATICLCGLGAIAFMPVKKSSDNSLIAVMWILYAWLSIYLPKIIWLIFYAFSNIPLIFNKCAWKWLSVTGISIGIIIFAAMWWGALINRFNINVTEIEINIPDLPDNFKDYRIVQFSDLHTGTFDSDTTFVSKLVETINSLNPDLIVFTGDIVNRRSEELIPFTETLSRLNARDGVMSILGNHDYGDYSWWSSPAEKQENMEQLYGLQKDMGWNLLLNQNMVLKRGNDSIAIVGVENIGDPPFTVYGSLPKATDGLSNDVMKILLTHNPAHWTDSIANHSNLNIPLSLSGHTHAMQIEIAGISPAVFRYKTWGGLYTDADKKHNLYVNIGAGEVGMPMRIGATPEVTVITLK